MSWLRGVLRTFRRGLLELSPRDGARERDGAPADPHTCWVFADLLLAVRVHPVSLRNNGADAVRRDDPRACVECGILFPDVRIAKAHQREVHGGTAEHPHANSPDGTLGKLLGPIEEQAE